MNTLFFVSEQRKMYKMKFFEKCKEIFEKKKWVRIVSYIAAAIIILLVGAHLFLGHIIKGTI